MGGGSFNFLLTGSLTLAERFSTLLLGIGVLGKSENLKNKIKDIVSL